LRKLSICDQHFNEPKLLLLAKISIFDKKNALKITIVPRINLAAWGKLFQTFDKESKKYINAQTQETKDVLKELRDRKILQGEGRVKIILNLE